MKHSKYRFGFTLVELIIVITILAILATIAFVSFQTYTSDSRDTHRIASIGQIQKGLDSFFISTGKFPLPDDIYATGFYMSGSTPELLTTVGYVKDGISRLVNIKKTPIDPSSGTSFVYGVSANQLKYQVAGTFENTQVSSIITHSYAASNQARVVGNYLYPLKLSNKLYSLPSLIFVGTGNLNNNSTGFIIHKSSNLAYTLDGKSLNNTQTFSEVAKLVTGSTGLTLTGVEIVSYTDPKSFKGLETLPTNLQALGVSKDVVGVSIFGDPYLAAIAPKPFVCGDTISTLDGTQSYTTKLGPDGKCWTSQNMRHGNMLTNAGVGPSNNSLLEKWCYSGLQSNCDTQGGLYTWQEAMGLNAGDTAGSVENVSKSVCGQLGSTWALPSSAQWGTLQSAGATGWTGNKISGIVSYLPGYIHSVMGYYQNGLEGYRWTSQYYDTSWAYYKSLTSASATIGGSSGPKLTAYSVICIKN